MGKTGPRDGNGCGPGSGGDPAGRLYLDYAGSDNVLTRYERLLYDEEIRSAWLSYAARFMRGPALTKISAAVFLPGRISGILRKTAPDMEMELPGERWQSRWIYRLCQGALRLKELSAFYGTDFSDYSEIYLPEKESYARKVLFEFYDAFLQKLLKETQAVFPDLSMEVRLDTDAVKKADGSLEGVPHWNTFAAAMLPIPASCTAFPWALQMRERRSRQRKRLKRHLYY